MPPPRCQLPTAPTHLPGTPPSWRPRTRDPDGRLGQSEGAWEEEVDGRDGADARGDCCCCEVNVARIRDDGGLRIPARGGEKGTARGRRRRRGEGKGEIQEGMVSDGEATIVAEEVYVQQEFEGKSPRHRERWTTEGEEERRTGHTSSIYSTNFAAAQPSSSAWRGPVQEEIPFQLNCLLLVHRRQTRFPPSFGTSRTLSTGVSGLESSASELDGVR